MILARSIREFRCVTWLDLIGFILLMPIMLCFRHLGGALFMDFLWGFESAYLG